MTAHATPVRNLTVTGHVRVDLRRLDGPQVEAAIKRLSDLPAGACAELVIDRNTWIPHSAGAYLRREASDILVTVVADDVSAVTAGVRTLRGIYEH